MSPEIQRADARWRRRVVAALALMLVFACAALVAFRHWLLTAHANASAPALENMRHWTVASLIGIGLCLLALAGCAARLARQTREQRRWPPLSMRVIRNTPIRSGDDALRIAHVLNAAACVLIVIAVATALASWLRYGSR